MLQSFTSFVIVKTNTTLNLENGDKFGTEEKLAVVVHALLITKNSVISRCRFAEDEKEIYQES